MYPVFFYQAFYFKRHVTRFPVCCMIELMLSDFNYNTSLCYEIKSRIIRSNPKHTFCGDFIVAMSESYWYLIINAIINIIENGLLHNLVTIYVEHYVIIIFKAPSRQVLTNYVSENNTKQIQLNFPTFFSFTFSKVAQC